MLLNRKSGLLLLEYDPILKNLLPRKSHHNYYCCYHYLEHLSRSRVILYTCSPLFDLLQTMAYSTCILQVLSPEYTSQSSSAPLATPEYPASHFHSASLRLVTSRTAVKG
jgi:hypothetical protein